MIDLIQLYEGYAKIFLLLIVFVLAFVKLRRQKYPLKGTVFIFILLCQIIGNLYWQVNYVLYSSDRFFFLSAEDFSFYGIMLLMAVLLEMDNGEYISGKVALGAGLFNMSMGGLYYGYGDSMIEVVLSASVMGILCARVLQGCLNRKVFGKQIWWEMTVLAFMECLLEISLFFLDGTGYQVMNIISYLLRAGTFLYLCLRILKELKADTAALLTLSVGGFLLTTYWQYMSEGIVYAIFDIFQPIMCYLILKAVFREGSEV